jgi:hypothetical protein
VDAGGWPSAGALVPPRWLNPVLVDHLGAFSSSLSTAKKGPDMVKGVLLAGLIGYVVVVALASAVAWLRFHYA